MFLPCKKVAKSAALTTNLSMKIVFCCFMLLKRLCDDIYFFLYTFNRVLAHSGLSLKDRLPGEAITLAEALMAPTVIYVKQVNNVVYVFL